MPPKEAFRAIRQAPRRARQAVGRLATARRGLSFRAGLGLMRWMSNLDAKVGAALAAAPRFAAARSRLAAFVDRVAAFNAKMDLTAARGDAELVDLMLADALELAARLPASARVVDVEGGLGAPGLPLAILRDDLEVCTLVRAAPAGEGFLRVAVGALAWPGDRKPKVVRDRGRRSPRLAQQALDVAISRSCDHCLAGVARARRPPRPRGLGATRSDRSANPRGPRDHRRPPLPLVFGRRAPLPVHYVEASPQRIST